jgi:hypothetical protein
VQALQFPRFQPTQERIPRFDVFNDWRNDPFCESVIAQIHKVARSDHLSLLRTRESVLVLLTIRLLPMPRTSTPLTVTDIYLRYRHLIENLLHTACDLQHRGPTEFGRGFADPRHGDKRK